MKKIARTLKTKSDLISEIARKKNVSLSVATLLVNTIFEEIIQSLLKGQKVELRGFGTFGVKKYRAYKGRNPRNQQRIMVRAKKRPWFKPGLLRKGLNTK